MSGTLHALLPFALLAPSRHNAQPWLFEIEGDELRVYGDVRRALPVADPQGRALVMACGAALHNVEVAARAAGFATSVEVVAGGRQDALLARLRLEERRHPTEEDRRLFEAVAQRRTNRLGFDDRPLPPGFVARAVRAAARLEVRVRAIDAPLRVAVAELVGEAGQQQWANPRFRAELAAWSRPNGALARDGVPGHAHGLSDTASVLHRLLVRVAGSAAPEEEARDRQQALHSPALLALGTTGDRCPDWLSAGRALQSVLLHAAAEGLSASFFSQVVEVPATRQRLRDAIGEPGWPQLVLRVGHGRVLRATPRRPLEEVLRAVASERSSRAIVRAGGPTAAWPG